MNPAKISPRHGRPPRLTSLRQLRERLAGPAAAPVPKPYRLGVLGLAILFRLRRAGVPLSARGLSKSMGKANKASAIYSAILELSDRRLVDVLDDDLYAITEAGRLALADQEVRP